MQKPYLLLLLVILCISVRAQEVKDRIGFDGGMEDRQEHYLSSDTHPIEKVYLQTDRDIYYPGDSIWFKAYLTDAFTLLPSDVSRTLYVELISPASEILVSRLIRMEDGMGHGDCTIPVDPPSGNYQLRAYTNYMRNFGEPLFFSKPITVVNPLKPARETNQIIQADNKVTLYFFPEGGSLTDSVACKVAFKAVNSQGKGCDIIGRVYSAAGEQITTFRSTHLGMGYFFLRPLQGNRYYAMFKGPDSIDVQVYLPISQPLGVNLGVLEFKNDSLPIVLKSNTQSLNDLKDKNLMLEISTRGSIVQSRMITVSGRLTSFKIPSRELSDGILTLTLKTSEGLPLSERLTFVQKTESPILRILPDKSTYRKREAVDLSIVFQGDSSVVGNTTISLAAANNQFLEDSIPFQRNIASWFLLESDLRGSIEEPSGYFDPDNPNRLKNLDILLMTQGWRDFTWKYDSLVYQPEKGFTISGRLRRLNLNRPVRGAWVNIAVIQSGRNLFYALPLDTLGRFALTDVDAMGYARIIASGTGKKDQLQGLMQLDSIQFIPPEVSKDCFITRKLETIRVAALNTEYTQQVTLKKKYSISDTVNIDEVIVVAQKPKTWQEQRVESSRTYYGKPDNEIIIKESMMGYPNLIEVMKGRIPGVTIVGSFPNYKIIVCGNLTIMGDNSVLILVDGSYARYDDLLYMPINIVDRIDVLSSINSSSIFGLRGANAVINIITRTHDNIPQQIWSSGKLTLQGYYTAKVFYSPQHEPDSKVPFVPDLRSTLYWAPDIHLEGTKTNNIRFYNGDLDGHIQITAEGMTETGIPVTGRAEYEIKSATP